MNISITDLSAAKRAEMLNTRLEEMAKEDYSFITQLTFEEGRKHAIKMALATLGIFFPEVTEEGGAS